MPVRLPLAFLAASFFAPVPAVAADAPAPAASKEGLAFYAAEVQPVLARHCYKCHSHAGGKSKGGLVVDSLGGMLTGGDTGPAVVPGDPDKSLLIKAVGFADEDLKMPPGEQKIPAADLAVLVKWVKQGAPAPAPEAGDKRTPGKITDEDRAWWAFQPVKSPPVPAADGANGGWTRNEIDRFILARLRAEGLSPSPEADRRAIARRLYFDLHGLPPTPAEVDAFVADPAPDAYEKLVDQLLASPRYGERWARHWLDLARYAESDGFRLDEYRPTAWRYRDYVVRAFNNDKPYDRFVTEQLAGDEVAPNDPDALAATGFLRHTIYEYNQVDARTQWSEMLNDLTDVSGEVFLGLGMGCARCHDHKFDPILQKDYYRLQAFFAAVLPADDVPLATPEQRGSHAAKLKAWEGATAAIRAEIEAVEAPYKAKGEKTQVGRFPEDIQAMIRKPVAGRTPLEHQLAELAYRQVYFDYGRIEKKMSDADKHKVAALRRSLLEFDRLKPPPLPVGLTVTDVGPVAPPTALPKKAAAVVEPGVLTLLDEKPLAVPTPAPGAKSTGRRAALAAWITRPDNPLTARVVVNRVWQQHFGRGLVTTASDFGRLGEKPSHPELLDYLASRFVAEGWSFKKLHRSVVLSATYRQSATAAPPAEGVRKDPENRLLWRASTRRLDAEQIRDAVLAATGELDPAHGGPSVDGVIPRRTVYTRATRNTRDPLLDVFDLPEGFTSTAQRNVTTTPTQALLLFNAQSYLQRARAMATRLQREATSNDARVALAYRLAYGRPPTDAERGAAVAFLASQGKRVDPKEGGKAGFYAEKMPYREGQAALLQPSGPQTRLTAEGKDFPTDTFTVESYVVLRSLYDDAKVRVLASHWNGDKAAPGWSFGVTSRRSAYKPQTLVLQLFPGGGGASEPVFSGLHLALNKPYFVAVSVNLKDTSKAGITFHAKDLSNDEEPMLSAEVAHTLKEMAPPPARFTIGGIDKPATQMVWDGLVDGLRVSKVALKAEQLMLTTEAASDNTVAYWPFELKPSPYADASGHGHDIHAEAPPAAGPAGRDRGLAALIDLCHALLNSNEFLYVD